VFGQIHAGEPVLDLGKGDGFWVRRGFKAMRVYLPSSFYTSLLKMRQEAGSVAGKRHSDPLQTLVVQRLTRLHLFNHEVEVIVSGLRKGVDQVV
jgi:hypothetical protein